MLDGISDLKTPYGIMSDLFDASPTELVSKVYFEDKAIRKLEPWTDSPHWRWPWQAHFQDWAVSFT